MLQISLLTSATDARPKPVTVPWEKLLSELQTHEKRSKKDGSAWVPATFRDCPPTCHRAGTKSDCGGSRSHRILENVIAVCCAVFDLDNATPEQLGQWGAALEPYTYAMHSTFSANGYRLILPLAEPVDPAKWGEVWEWIRDRLGFPLKTKETGGVDGQCKDPTRLYYFPTHDSAATWEPVVCDNTAALFYVAWAPPPAAPAAPAFISTMTPHHSGAGAGDEEGYDRRPPEKISEPVDIYEVKRQLKAVRKHESAALVRKVLAGESLQADDGSYDGQMNRVSSILATAITPPISWEVALEILRPSLAATPQQREGHMDHWIDEMEDMFHRAQQRRAKADAKQEELDAALSAALGWKDGGGVTSESNEWKSGLLVTLDQDGELAGLKQVGANANLILANDPKWLGKVKFNDVTKEIDVLDGSPLCGISKNVLDVEAANWLARSEYRLNLGTRNVAEQMLAVARRNSYDPLAVWLVSNRLKWDGQKRLENFLCRYFGAIGNPRYLEQVGKCWMIGAVARALSPGCRMDNVLILQGAQGKLKSTALGVLGGEHFSDTKFDPRDKDGRMMASRFWIIEMGELASMSKSDDAMLKTFFSARRDDIRVPYGKVLESFPRRCVFAGTVNPESDYLTDPTGNRRYWPVAISAIDIEALKAERDQLWAEAVLRFNAGEKWWLEGDDIELARKEQEAVTQQSSRIEPIISWWMRLQSRPDFVTTLQVGTEALSLLTAQASENKMQQEIGAALRAIGCTRGKATVGGMTRNVYFIPQTMKDMKPGAKILELVENTK